MIQTFCKNCRYFRDTTNPSGLYVQSCCTLPTGEMSENWIHGHYMEETSRFLCDPDYPNKDGKCKYYKTIPFCIRNAFPVFVVFIVLFVAFCWFVDWLK